MPSARLRPDHGGPTRPSLKLLWAAACLAVPALTTSASAQGATEPTAMVSSEQLGANLNISPKRLTLTRTQRTASVYIFNQGSAPATFDISLVDRVMLPDGRISAIEDVQAAPELKPYADRVASARPMLVAAPRRVTLAPGKGQTIRVRAAPGAETDPAAEYRTHLTVTTVPPRGAGLTAEDAASLRPNEIQFSIRSVFGVSIPIIVRMAEPQVAARLENPRMGVASLSADGLSAPRPTPVARVDVVRAGSSSLFGDLEVIAHKGRSSEVIGAARGLGVYTEIDRRAVQVPLGRAPKKGERLEVRFSDSDTAPGKLLAAGNLVTP